MEEKLESRPEGTMSSSVKAWMIDHSTSLVLFGIAFLTLIYFFSFGFWTFLGLLIVTIVTKIIRSQQVVRKKKNDLASVSWEKENLLPHKEIVQIHPHGLWVVEGCLPYPLPRNMAIYRIPTDTYKRKAHTPELLLHSVVALSEDGMEALDRLGKVKYAIVPSLIHTMDIKRYMVRYPSMKVLCPASIKKDLEVKLSISVHGTCEEVFARPEMGVHCISPRGIKEGELVYELALLRESEPVEMDYTSYDVENALVFNDLLFNLPSDSGLIPYLLGSSGFFGVTRIGRWMLMKDAKEFKADLEEWAKRRIACVVMSHGKPITEHVSERFLQAAERLSS
eukprot:TRINITY_DN81144_c0_g1_i1.p1 TRINITY_DN81144_c0_g1~~TRINITY_DN81144_c0_g1_i1.p1  ORF type:complete len:337 (-),score=97.70 TRINITY_DN81144_c0_g1_i1:116-1126(-)